MISKNAVYWIWITQAIGYNSPKAKRLAELYPDVSQLYLRGEREWRLSGVFGASDIANLRSNPIENAQRVIDRSLQLGYSVISIDDIEEYPRSLYHIYAPPAVLYVSGKLPDLDDRLAVGIVGTRTASRYGVENSYKIAYSLSKYNVPIISGGALGVDCASHRGALAADGVSVCVRGCGINCSYLRENADMRRAITKRGAVISEYPPDEQPRSYYFPARNRIIAALSDGVVIIESGIRSGSLITADLALEMGKELFALLGNNSPNNEGSNKRIKEGTAIPITDFMDIIAAFESYATDNYDFDIDSISLADIDSIPVKAGRKTAKTKPAESGKNLPSAARKSIMPSIKIDKQDKPKEKPVHKKADLQGDAARIYNYLTAEPVHIDKIAADLNIPVYKALSSLTFLEMQDLITALQGRNFVLK